MADLQSANHYVFDGEGTSSISGVIDTTSITGRPTASIDVDGTTATDVTVEHGATGWNATGALSASDDGDSVDVTVLVPDVNVEAEAEAFIGVATIVTQRSSIGGPGLVRGALQSYEVRSISGTASIVEF